MIQKVLDVHYYYFFFQDKGVPCQSLWGNVAVIIKNILYLC
jgi:hypothetical protein